MRELIYSRNPVYECLRAGRRRFYRLTVARDMDLGPAHDLLAEARQTGVNLLMNEINVGETYYILSRKRGPEKADFFIETILSGLPIRRAPNDFEQVIAAARALDMDDVRRQIAEQQSGAGAEPKSA